MQFRDTAFDEAGQARDGHHAGVNFISDTGRWRVVAGDRARPYACEWHVWQHVDADAPVEALGSWKRRLSWVRMPSPEAAQAVAEVLAALPASVSWEVARAEVRRALRGLGAALFFRAMSSVNRGATILAAGLRSRTPEGPRVDD